MAIPDAGEKAALCGTRTENGREGKPPLCISVRGTSGCLKFSRNAEENIRPEHRLTVQNLRKLVDTVDQMRSQGASKALICFKGSITMIVSVKNRTVITAMDGESANDRIFTNIDSVAIL